MTIPGATVVVCTRNRAQILDACLRSILADRSTTPFEIVVIDNASTDDTAAIVQAAAGVRADVRVRHVLESKLGHSHARNRGVAEAAGELILFTDDDVYVEDGWVDAFSAAFDDPRVGAAGGRILPVWPQPPPAWLNGPHKELLALIDYGPEPRAFAEGEHPLGANMATRTALARSFDPPFDPRLGHRGNQRMAHEEVHFMNRVRQDHVLAYRPDAVVHHRVAPERMDLDWMRATFFELGVGLGRRERYEGVPLPSVPVRIVRAWRMLRGVSRERRRNDRSQRTGPETWDELYGTMWAGKHVEMLLGRWPRATDRLVGLVGRRLG